MPTSLVSSYRLGTCVTNSDINCNSNTMPRSHTSASPDHRGLCPAHLSDDESITHVAAHAINPGSELRGSLVAARPPIITTVNSEE